MAEDGRTAIVTGLDPGEAVITARTSEGVSGAAPITVPNTAPTVFITTPANDAVFFEDQPITFEGGATDLEDGDLSGGSLVWTSDLDGQIGAGASVVSSAVSVGRHLVTLTGTDRHGGTGESTITINIEASESCETVGMELAIRGLRQTLLIGSLESFHVTVSNQGTLTCPFTVVLDASQEVSAIGATSSEVTVAPGGTGIVDFLVRGEKPGTAEITARVTSADRPSASAGTTVLNLEGIEVTLEPGEALRLPDGDITALGFPDLPDSEWLIVFFDATGTRATREPFSKVSIEEEFLGAFEVFFSHLRPDGTQSTLAQEVPPALEEGQKGLAAGFSESPRELHPVQVSHDCRQDPLGCFNGPLSPGDTVLWHEGFSPAGGEFLVWNVMEEDEFNLALLVHASSVAAWTDEGAPYRAHLEYFMGGPADGNGRTGIQTLDSLFGRRRPHYPGVNQHLSHILPSPPGQGNAAFSWGDGRTSFWWSDEPWATQAEAPFIVYHEMGHSWTSRGYGVTAEYGSGTWQSEGLATIAEIPALLDVHFGPGAQLPADCPTPGNQFCWRFEPFSLDFERGYAVTVHALQFLGAMLERENTLPPDRIWGTGPHAQGPCEREFGDPLCDGDGILSRMARQGRWGCIQDQGCAEGGAGLFGWVKSLLGEDWDPDQFMLDWVAASLASERLEGTGHPRFRDPMIRLSPGVRISKAEGNSVAIGAEIGRSASLPARPGVGRGFFLSDSNGAGGHYALRSDSEKPDRATWMVVRIQ